MAIFTEKLVSASVLQDYIVDKSTAQALAAGVITCYKDENRTELKNWYYQTGTPGLYTYTQLPNPMTLSGVGTMVDVNGNDTIPFYYPWSEDDSNQPEFYYITVDSADGQRQFVRQGFPFSRNNGNETNDTNVQNYIVNNRFWRYGTSVPGIQTGNSINLTNQENIVLCPSQHDGFSMPDFRFIKDLSGATESVTFETFPKGTPEIQNDIQPEYYLRHVCTAKTTGESVKYYQYPISLHLATLALQKGTITIQLKNGSGNVNNTVSIYVLAFPGTSNTPVTFPPAIKTLQAPESWQKFEVPFTFPDNQTITVSETGDDAFYLLIGLPTDNTFDISFAIPSLYLTQGNVPINDFATYDQIDAIINSPRTGDFKISSNALVGGYVPANNGTIGSSGSSATTRANTDTWPLYSLLWSTMNNTFAPISSGSRGLSAYDDFVANYSLGLPKALGRILMGLPTSSTFTYAFATSLLTVADATLFYPGSPVTVSNSGGALPAAFTAGTVYYAIPISATTLKLASSYANAIAGTAVAAGASDGTGTQTIEFAIGGSFGESAHIQTIAELAAHTHSYTRYATLPGQSGSATACWSGESTQQTSSTGTGVPSNIIPPVTYTNFYLKL